MTSASGRFGVTTSAIGISFRFNASTASSRSRRSLLFATITGSSTSFDSLWWEIPAATTWMIAALEQHPRFQGANLEVFGDGIKLGC